MNPLRYARKVVQICLEANLTGGEIAEIMRDRKPKYGNKISLHMAVQALREAGFRVSFVGDSVIEISDTAVIRKVKDTLFRHCLRFINDPTDTHALELSDTLSSSNIQSLIFELSWPRETVSWGEEAQLGS